VLTEVTGDLLSSQISEDGLDVPIVKGPDRRAGDATELPLNVARNIAQENVASPGRKL
jgi:hypothetical protein